MTATRDDQINVWLEPLELTIEQLAPSTDPLVKAMLEVCDELIRISQQVNALKREIVDLVTGNHVLGGKGAAYDAAFAALDHLRFGLGHMAIAYKANQARTK